MIFLFVLKEKPPPPKKTNWNLSLVTIERPTIIDRICLVCFSLFNREVLCYTSLSNGVCTSALEINLGNSELDLRSNTELWHKLEADFATIILFEDIFYGPHIFIPYFPYVTTHLFSWKILSKSIEHLSTERLSFKDVSWNTRNTNR